MMICVQPLEGRLADRPTFLTGLSYKDWGYSVIMHDSTKLVGLERDVFEGCCCTADKADQTSTCLRCLLSNIVAPFPQSLDDLWQDGSCKRNSEKDQGLVYKVGQSELCPDR